MKYLGLKIEQEQGFTVVELIVAFTIMAILAGITIPTLGTTLDRYRLKDATRDLVSFMQDAKMAALAQNTDQVIRFDESASPGFYYWDLNDNASHDTDEPRIDLNDYGSEIDYGSGSTSTNWEPEAISSTKLVTFDGKELTFSDRGMGEPGTVYLQNKNADICFAVTVLFTGSIKIREWTGTVWND